MDRPFGLCRLLYDRPLSVVWTLQLKESGLKGVKVNDSKSEQSRESGRFWAKLGGLLSQSRRSNNITV